MLWLLYRSRYIAFNRIHLKRFFDFVLCGGCHVLGYFKIPEAEHASVTT
ncbi:MAG: hypothetical protein LBJ00_16625 [Planctomycetaceae bacterium]|nr:hypothetical protein [Planctomycetaceae bacterium]